MSWVACETPSLTSVAAPCTDACNATASPGCRSRRPKSSANGSRRTRSATSTSTAASCVTPTASSSCSSPSTGFPSSPTSSSTTARARGRARPFSATPCRSSPIRSTPCSPTMAWPLPTCPEPGRPQPPLPGTPYLRPSLHEERHRAPVDQALSPLDQRPGRANEPHDQGRHSQDLPLRRSAQPEGPCPGLRHRLQLRQPLEGPEMANALSSHLRGLDESSRNLQNQSAPPHSETTQLAFIFWSPDFSTSYEKKTKKFARASFLPR